MLDYQRIGPDEQMDLVRIRMRKAVGYQISNDAIDTRGR